MALAVPFVIGGIEALLAALGIGLAATAIALAQNSNLPAKVRQWLSDHASEFDEQSKKQERREPTPVTVPSLFEYSTIEGKKVAVKKKVGKFGQLIYFMEITLKCIVLNVILHKENEPKQ